MMPINVTTTQGEVTCCRECPNIRWDANYMLQMIYICGKKKENN